MTLGSQLRTVLTAILLFACGVALQAAVVRWIAAGSVLDGHAQGVVVIMTSLVLASTATRGHRRAAILAVLVFVVAAILLSAATIALECTIRPTGCDA
jgi:hypothetical protein